MELNKKERLILYNQYEILKLLNKNDDYMVKMYETNQEILLNGFKYSYDDMFTWILNDTSDDVSKFVWDVFSMYRALHNSYHELPEESKKQIDLDDITYQGYDGNEESDYYMYANFILEKMERFDEIYDKGKVELNSHSNMVGIYKNMLNTWERIRGEKYNSLSTEQISEIVKSKYYDLF